MYVFCNVFKHNTIFKLVITDKLSLDIVDFL